LEEKDKELEKNTKEVKKLLSDLNEKESNKSKAT
jgi:hypothetical protein